MSKRLRVNGITRALTCVTLFVATVSSVRGGEGFGMMKKSVTLLRSLPPLVRLVGNRISVHVTAQKKSNASLAERMENQLESELIGSDTKLSLDSKTPTTVVDVAILRNDYSETSENRQETRGQQTGTNSKNLRFGLGQANVRYKVIKHSFSVTLKVRDSRSSKTLLADTIVKNFKQSFEDGNGAPDANSLEDANMTSVVTEITRRLTPTKETIAILLPKGRLEDAAAYGQAGLWNKYLDALSSLPAAPSPLDESYRQYAMGVAYEALGYGADDLDTSLKYLEKAATLYNAAAEANPKETNFILGSKPSSLLGRAENTASRLIPILPHNNAERKEVVMLQAPLGRVQAALVQYQKLRDLGGGPTKPAGGKAVADALTNEAIVEMLRAGISEEVITTTIDSASRRSLDVSPKGLIQLSEAKASTTLLKHIQDVGSKSGSKGKKE